jgi:hypothetical protein
MEDELNPREVIEQLRIHHAHLQWAPLPPQPKIGDWTPHELITNESLAFLHANHQLPDPDDADTGGKGLRARLQRRSLRRTMEVLTPRMKAEQDLLVSLIRVTDALARRCDELSELMATRQVEEAANQARLSAWLHSTTDGPVDG